MVLFAQSHIYLCKITFAAAKVVFIFQITYDLTNLLRSNCNKEDCNHIDFLEFQ